MLTQSTLCSFTQKEEETVAQLSQQYNDLLLEGISTGRMPKGFQACEKKWKKLVHGAEKRKVKAMHGDKYAIASDIIHFLSIGFGSASGDSEAETVSSMIKRIMLEARQAAPAHFAELLGTDFTDTWTTIVNSPDSIDDSATYWNECDRIMLCLWDSCKNLPGNKEGSKQQAITEAERLAELGVIRTASSPSYHFIQQAVATTAMQSKQTKDSSISKFPYRMKSINRNARYRVTQNVNGSYTLQRDKDDAITTITIDPGHMNQTAERLLNIVFNEVAYDVHRNPDGTLANNELTIPFKTFIENGIYADEKTIRDAVKRAKQGIVSTLINVTTTKNGRTKEDMAYPAFIKFGHKNGCVRAKLNSEMTYWSDIFQYRALAPSYVYSLPIRAMRLLLAICYHARQRDAAPFNMKYSSVMLDMGLPDIDEVQKIATQLRKPIEEAVDEIHIKEAELIKAGKLTCRNLEIEIHDAADECGIRGGREWTEQSYLRITPLGNMYSELQATKQRNDIAKDMSIKRIAKKEEIKQKAIGKRIADKILPDKATAEQKRAALDAIMQGNITE